MKARQLSYFRRNVFNRITAHVIRNCSTKQFRAVRSLRSLIRWCLTGTPIQNSLDDLGSLVTFLRTPVLEESIQFRNHITSYVQSKKSDPASDFQNLHMLLRSICLRRNKAVLPLFSSVEEIHEMDFTTEERHEYDRLGEKCLMALNLAVSGHQTKESHKTVLQAILKLRLFCNNGPGFDSSTVRDEPSEAFSLLQQGGLATCHYCSCDITSLATFGDPESANITPCHALVCAECIEIYNHDVKATFCPICKSQHLRSLEQLNHCTHEASHSITKHPTKLKKLCSDLQTHQQIGKRYVTCVQIYKTR
jgi:SNF2 family DNA or RNA helicase